MRQYKIHKNHMCYVIFKYNNINSVEHNFSNNGKTLYRGGNERVNLYKQAKQYYTENDVLSDLALIKFKDGKRES